MKRSTSNQEVKKLNRNRVFRYVNSREETSMPEISAALSISGPTVLKIVNELKEEKLLREVGEFESTGGRKAKAIAGVRDVKYAIGLDITKNHVGIVYTDLSGKALKHERVRKPFKYSQTYLHEVAAIVRRFVEAVFPRSGFWEWVFPCLRLSTCSGIILRTPMRLESMMFPVKN